MVSALSALPREKIRAVFTDLDDTLTRHSRLSSSTYRALERLSERGYLVVIVSGRPAGWADCLMRMWPLDAMVFENGAGIVTRDREKLRVTNLAPDADLPAQRKHLAGIFDRLKAKIPHLHLASDQAYRLFDYAIDYAEEPPYLSEGELKEVMDTLASETGITAKLSSIHANYWYGTHTKVTACRYLLETAWKDRSLGRDQVVYSGDSPNDEPLFAFFDHTVGVANIRPYLPRLKSPPRYLADKPGGEGFQEIVSHLLGSV